MIHHKAVSALALGVSLAMALPSMGQAAEALCFRGLNLSGAEYGDKNGVYGTNYTYPSEKTVTYFADKGMNTVRLPIKWERLQPQLNGKLNSNEVQMLTESVSLLRKHGMQVILDPHNFGYYDGKRLGTGDVKGFAFADFWARLAIEFANQDGVIFGLMNEPYDISGPDWLKAANSAILSIRAVKANNLILVPGTIWSGASSWEKDIPGGANGVVMLGVVDPADNYAYELHQYMDEDYSGTHETCVNAAGARQALLDVTDWLRKNNKRGFLGEFGGSSDKDCLEGLKGMTGAIRDNSDVWLGWTYWAAGDWWPATEALNIQPTAAGDRKQLSVLLSKDDTVDAARCALPKSAG